MRTLPNRTPRRWPGLLLPLLLLGGCEGALLDPIPDNICDGVDDDGDGRVDEDPPCNGCPAGTVVPEGWVCAPAGVFVMGSPEDEAGRDRDESPQFERRITRPFLASATEVTQAEWRALGSIERFVVPDCDDCPARGMNWFEAVLYANARSSAEGLPRCYIAQRCYDGGGQPSTFCDGTTWPDLAGCRGYRLPSESEWEYMARAGTDTAYWFGDDPAELPRVGHFGAGDRPQPVGRLAPNPWGLLDIHGNVLEWTWNQEWPYPIQEAQLWAPAPLDADRITRGGNFRAPANGLRSASRHPVDPRHTDGGVGLRLVRSVPPAE